MEREFYFNKNEKERIVISTNEFNGQRYIDVRQNWKSGEEFLPSRKGFNFAADKWGEFLVAVHAFDRKLQSGLSYSIVPDPGKGQEFEKLQRQEQETAERKRYGI